VGDFFGAVWSMAAVPESLGLLQSRGLVELGASHPIPVDGGYRRARCRQLAGAPWLVRWRMAQAPEVVNAGPDPDQRDRHRREIPVRGGGVGSQHPERRHSDVVCLALPAES